MISPTVRRVPRNTAAEVNLHIQQNTEEHVAFCAAAGPDAITRRLEGLDREWDIERVLEAMAATLSLSGVLLGMRDGGRRWLVVPALVTGFLLQHALQGWCPPLPALRRLGFRTAREIDQERYALKALRGDFRQVEPISESQASAAAAEALSAAKR